MIDSALTLDEISFSGIREDNTDSFKKFTDDFNFAASTLVLSSFGMLLLTLSMIPNTITSSLAFVVVLACSTWLKLHGAKLTRNEVIYFEVRNLLEVDPPVFHFGLDANSDECITPGDGEQREPPQPQTLWEALFTNEKSMRMDKFYRQHYGRVHATGQKLLQEYEMQKAKEKNSPRHGLN